MSRENMAKQHENVVQYCTRALPGCAALADAPDTCPAVAALMLACDNCQPPHEFIPGESIENSWRSQPTKGCGLRNLGNTYVNAHLKP